ncbi:MAG: sodium:calcium antiporter, partial [Bacteroidia bacterium]
MVSLFILMGGFTVLVFGARILVDSSSSLARRLNIPDIVIGLTIVAFGTSSPELLVSLMASAEGNSDLALGNVIGSNIFNILFILGISAILSPLKIKTGTTWIEVPLTFLSAVVVLLLANDIFIDKASASIISRSDGIILLMFFLVFLVYNITVMMNNSNEEKLVIKEEATWKSALFIIGGLILLVAGGRAIVYSSVKMAQMAGLSERVIGLTIVSVGTSLPEAATSIVAALRKNTDIA